MLILIFRKFLHQSKLFLNESNSNESATIGAPAGLADLSERTRESFAQIYLHNRITIVSPIILTKIFIGGRSNCILELF